jgi:hypothetical protein
MEQREAVHNRRLLDVFVHKIWHTVQKGVLRCGVWTLAPSGKSAGIWVDLRDGAEYDYETFCDVACSVILAMGASSIVYRDLVLVSEGDTYFRQCMRSLDTIAQKDAGECAGIARYLLESHSGNISLSDRLHLVAIINFYTGQLPMGLPSPV